MAYGRYKRMRRYRRKPQYARKPSKQFARKVRKVMQSVQEKKYWPYTSNISVSSAGYLLHLTNIAQGDSDTTRDGDALNLKSILINLSAAAGDTYNIMRYTIFQWLPSSSLSVATPTLGDIYQDTTTPVISTFAHDSRKNYRILYDTSFTVDTDFPNKVKHIRIYGKKLIRQVQYVGGTVVGNNNVYMWAVSDSGAATHPSVTYVGKTNFTDS